MRVKAVLFDSGGVLMRPIGGRWNPRLDFEETVLRHKPGITVAQFAAAAAVGYEWMGSNPSGGRDGYHRVMLEILGVDATAELLAELSTWMDPNSVVEPYPEVVGVLEELRARGLRLAVVSDAGPGLPLMHDAIGLAGYFEAYAISAVLGCNKPDPRMYHHASDALGLEPRECLFVDDIPDYVAAAIRLGYEGVVVRPEQPTELASMQDLTELVARLDA